ncbi:MAG: hypothetical protein WBO15_10760 [Gammaproteobacteria bacterium]
MSNPSTHSVRPANTLLIDFGDLGIRLGDWAGANNDPTTSGPGMSRLLSRGQTRSLPVNGREAVTGFLLTGCADALIAWPAGPVGFLGGFGERPKVVIRADPVCLSPSADRLILSTAQMPKLSMADADSLVRYLNAGLEAREARLYLSDAQRWYLTLPAAPSGRWWAPWALLGQHVLDFMPSGKGCELLNSLVTEVQMMLHEHPINLQREAAGLPLINSLWPWGWAMDEPEPEMPALLHAPQVSEIADADAYVAGLMMLAGEQPVSLPGDSHTSSHTSSHSSSDTADEKRPFALVSPQPGDSATEFRRRLERDWCGPWSRDLLRGRIKRLRIASVDGDCCEVRRADLFRVWRRGLRMVDAD